MSQARRNTSAVLVLLLAACAPAPGPAPAAPPATEATTQATAAATRIEADVRFLADDLLEGREAGTRGYDLAARYVAARFAALGLVPAGDDGTWLQEVPMLRGVREREGARFVIERDGARTELAFETDFLPGINYADPAAQATAPMVFVAYGVHAPELGWDDYAEVDVKGKIAVMLNGAPASFPIDQRAFHSSGLEKSRQLEARGAIGVVTLRDPDEEARRPWALDAPNWRRPGMRLIDARGAQVDDLPGLKGRAGLRTGMAALLLEGSGVSAEELWAMRSSGTLRRFELAGKATLASPARIDRVASDNVLAKLPGSDPALGAQHVLLSAHLDHLGR